MNKCRGIYYDDNVVIGYRTEQNIKSKAKHYLLDTLHYQKYIKIN